MAAAKTMLEKRNALIERKMLADKRNAKSKRLEAGNDLANAGQNRQGRVNFKGLGRLAPKVKVPVSAH